MTLIAQPSIGDWAEWTQAIIVFLIALVAGYWALVRFRFPETDRPVLKTVIGGVAWSPNEEMLVIIFEVANDHRVPVELGPWAYAVFDVDVDPHPKAPDQPWLYQLRGEKWDRFVKHSPGNVVPAHSSVGFVYSVPMQNLGRRNMMLTALAQYVRWQRRLLGPWRRHTLSNQGESVLVEVPPRSETTARRPSR